MIVTFYRLIITCLVVLGYLLQALLTGVFSRLFLRDDMIRRQIAAKNLSQCSRLLIRLLKINIEFDGVENLKPGRAYFIVANHLSYIDVIVMSSQISTLFVTSVEIQTSGLLGTICEAAGCLFVERRNRSKLPGELAQIRNVLQHGLNVVVFPEATSSDGQAILPFKSALFGSAIQTSSPVLPMCLNYSKANGKSLTPQLRDSICYYGDMTFFDHFRRFMALRSIDVRLTILPALEVTPETDRKGLSDQIFQNISSRFISAVRVSS